MMSLESPYALSQEIFICRVEISSMIKALNFIAGTLELEIERQRNISAPGAYKSISI